MKRSILFPLPHAALVILALLSLASPPPAAAGEVAEVRFGPAAVDFAPLTDYGSMVLTVSGPDGFYLREKSAAGETASFSLFDETGSTLADGTYTYELQVVPHELRRRRGPASDHGLESRAGAAGARRVQHGAFSVRGGLLVDPGTREPEAASGAPGEARLATRDQVFTDDLIVVGSLCVGFDCFNGETFGTDTIRLKENNLRIKFQDTSADSFPTNDWELTANDSANGGRDRFSILDVDGAQEVFTVEAGAGANALYVDDQGDVGVGTVNPVLELHVLSGDTPGLRLEQDASAGFTPQTWDVAGNEVNLFVRDITNGSTLPLRIFAGAPTNSIYVADTGNVGLGTDTPAERLDVNGHIALSGTRVHFTRSGVATVTAGSGNTVTFGEPFDSADYSVVLTPLTDGSTFFVASVTDRTTTGFTFAVERIGRGGGGALAGLEAVAWMAQPASP